jgi:nucleoside-diphosphate-sugar epimerase
MIVAVVLGAGGFIGNHLVNKLKNDGCYVIAVDLKFPVFEKSKVDDFTQVICKIFQLLKGISNNID